MGIFNSILNFIFDTFFNSFDSLHPIYGLSAISLLTTLIVLPIFRYFSNQEGIKRTRGRIVGHLFEVRIFKDDLRIFFTAMKNILKYNAIYMAYMLKPLLFMILPVLVIMVQTETRYAHRPLSLGETAIVKVKQETGGTFPEKGSDVLLTVPEGLRLETPPLRYDEGSETYWKIRAERKGEFELRFYVLDKELKRRVVVKDEITRISPLMLKKGILNSFFHPGEPSLSQSTNIKSIEVKYPYMNISVFGWRIHWLLIFFILTLSFGFVLMKPFRVKF
ncbi:MAG: hypothetical protein SWO11_03925 [Thermodesulfobacteriota bacterium]|nr:hypothetical protein [Thermodesulfobacteriota bacterium]